AAADVDDDGDVAWNADAVHGRRMDESRFFRTRNHLRPNARLVSDGPEEVAPILGLARRAGRDGDNVVDAMRFGQTPEFREHLESRVHSLRRERAAVQTAGAEADHFLL